MQTKRKSMEWGSCQYDAAAEMFDRCIEMEAGIGRNAVLESLGIGCVDDLASQLPNIAYEKLVEEMRTRWLTDDYMLANLEECVEKYPDKTISNCFKICADMAMDLWTTAPYIVKLVFPNIELDKIPPTPHNKLYGPTLNQIAQAGNDATGFCCWLMVSFDLATELDFIGFDT